VLHTLTYYINSNRLLHSVCLPSFFLSFFLLWLANWEPVVQSIRYFTFLC
jgi:hypothetical protein